MYLITRPASKRYQKLLISALASILFIFATLKISTTLAQEPGEKDFNTSCVTCHTIGGGRLIGPDLVGVTDKRTMEWLSNFIRSPQSLIDSGDTEAVDLAKEYAGLVMPDAAMDDAQIADIISYIRSKSAAASEEGVAASVNEIVAPELASEEEILAGQHYFQGELRLENGGAACNACHDVRNDAVIGGGVLATELTTTFSRMGRAGMKAILGHAPFPVMQAAYKDKPLTETEISALVAFLQFADSEEYNQLPRDYGLGLFLTGVVGAGFMFAFFGFVWRGRKRESVNQAIYDRQIKSDDLTS